MKTEAALPWFGSDGDLSEQLASRLDECKHVTILFCGGLSILKYLKARSVLANDRHELALNFYRVAGGVYGEDARKRLIGLCQNTLSHPGEMKLAQEQQDSICKVTSAWAFWSICWLGRKGKGGTKSQGGKPSIRRTADGGNNASRIRAAADDLQEWFPHFQKCEWECEDFRVILPKVKNIKGCGLYLDPPWVGPGVDYLHSFGEAEHREMRALLERFRESPEAMVLIRYGDAPLIRELYAGWKIEQAEFRDQANQNKPELWISNRFGD